MHVTPAHIERLAQFDTPTICNVIELFHIRPRHQGYMDQRIVANFPELPPMVGFAATASFRSSGEPGVGDAYGNMVAQIESFADLPGPPVVVFQDLDHPAIGATFGEIMCSTYKSFGSAGLITSGGGRDLLQVKALAYPVFTGGTVCSHAYCHLLHLGLPVHVGGLVVRQGDLLHGDANGVSSIPLEIAAEVADIAPDFVGAESIILEYVRGAGVKNAKGLAAAQAEFASAARRLADRVRRKS